MIDVINARRGVNVRWLRVFQKFVTRLAGMIVDRGYRYILLPDSSYSISNYDYIRDEIYSVYRQRLKIAPDEFWLESMDPGFHSTNCEYLVIWENRIFWGESA